MFKEVYYDGKKKFAYVQAGNSVRGKFLEDKNDSSNIMYLLFSVYRKCGARSGVTLTVTSPEMEDIVRQACDISVTGIGRINKHIINIQRAAALMGVEVKFEMEELVVRVNELVDGVDVEEE